MGDTPRLTFIDYQHAALSNIPRNPATEDLTRAALGATCAIGKLSHLVLKNTILHKEITNAQVLHELGAVLWYITLAANAIGSTLEAAAQENLATTKGVKP